MQRAIDRGGLRGIHVAPLGIGPMTLRQHRRGSRSTLSLPYLGGTLDWTFAQIQWWAAPLVIAMFSQKGGVGKSTLVRGLATFAVGARWKTKVADLDLEQKTVMVWDTTRSRHGLKPALDVQAFDDVRSALDNAGRISGGASRRLTFRTPAGATD